MTTASDLISSSENLAAKADLFALICGERALLFAGAGVAIPAGFPSWTKLLEGLEGICDVVGTGFVRDAGARKSSPIEYADVLKAHIQTCAGDLSRYTDYLVNEFRRLPRLQEFHRDLVLLPFRGFVTTNYESTIESALSLIEHQPPDKTVILGGPGPLTREFHASLIPALGRKPGQRLVAHIHGHYRDPASIVLSKSDYVIAYGLTATIVAPPAYILPPLVDFLHVVLAPWSLVFVGFSFQDPQFEVLLEAAGKRFGLRHTSTHFALMPTTDKSADEDRDRAQRLKADYGIETVFFEQVGSSFDRLYDIVREIRQTCGLISPDSLPDINVRTIVGMRT